MKKPMPTPSSGGAPGPRTTRLRLDEAARKAISGHLPTSFKGMRDLMDLHPQSFAATLTKLNSCSGRRRCYSRFCPTCKKVGLKGINKFRQEAIKATRPERSPDPQVRGRQTMQPFHWYPPEECAFVTVNLAAPEPHELRSVIRTWRNEIHRRLRSTGKDLEMLGRIEFDAKLAGSMVPVVDAANLALLHPDCPVFLVHAHMVIHWSGHSFDDIRRLFRELFAESTAVNVRPITNSFEFAGYKGLEGIGSYICKEHTKLKPIAGASPSEIVEVLVAYDSVKRTDTSLVHNMRAHAKEVVRENGRILSKLRVAVPSFRDKNAEEVWDAVAALEASNGDHDEQEDPEHRIQSDWASWAESERASLMAEDFYLHHDSDEAPDDVEDFNAYERSDQTPYHLEDFHLHQESDEPPHDVEDSEWQSMLIDSIPV